MIDPTSQIPDTGTPVVCLANSAGVHRFTSPLRTLIAWRLDEVVALLREIEREAEAGHVALGFVSYEAAPAFDPALSAHSTSGLPLAWFGIFTGPGVPVPGVPPPTGDLGLDWRAEVDENAYRASVSRIRAWIAAGDTYQVNYTYPTRAAFDGDPGDLFSALAAAQPTEYGIYFDLGRYAVASVSPELFFRLDGERILTRPMKGTASRGLWYEDDQRRADELRASPKERAENVMIVDMIRNDLGRIARTGTVKVTSLFDTERHPTVWQMTSSVEARTDAGLAEIFGALFPCASVTGAPKVRTMEIIREIERGPRGVYCGALGWMGPGRSAQFSVGIRTATIDRETRTASYHVGSGVTWDSAAADEYTECRMKATVLAYRLPEFDLVESLRWEEGLGYAWLDAHLVRLRNSACYFGFAYDEGAIRAVLEAGAATLREPTKVRLLLARHGGATVDVQPILRSAGLHVALSLEPVDPSNVFLYHKTTQRDVYVRARSLRPDCDDTILWNDRGEVTESTIGNVCVRFGDDWYTPPVECGLLPGVMRGHLLRAGRIHEARITLERFRTADEIALINAVRGWMTPVVVETDPQPLAVR